MFPPHPVETIPGDPASGLLLICEHASNHVPEDLAQLGVPEREFARHIAYDIGAAEVTRRLAAHLGVPAILTRFSRLVIDPNRGREDPTLVMRLSDGAVVPGNARIDEAGKEERIRRFYVPFDEAVDTAVAQARGGRRAALHRHDAQFHGLVARLYAALACGHPVGQGRPYERAPLSPGCAPTRPG